MTSDLPRQLREHAARFARQAEQLKAIEKPLQKCELFGFALANLHSAGQQLLAVAENLEAPAPKRTPRVVLADGSTVPLEVGT
jgi:hypothetical protein